MPQTADAENEPEAVFDCNIFFRAAIQNHGFAYRCVLLLETARFTLFYCREILEEINDVLRRPSLRQRFPTLTDENVDALIRKLERHAVKITNVPETFRYSRDPDDEVYVNLALVTDARYLVTYDRDLLDLMVGSSEEAVSFRHRFPGLQIVDPQAFLTALEGQH